MCGKTSHLKGVKTIPLKTNYDNRGSFTEIYRKEWLKNLHPVQWNIVLSKRKTIRGMRVHKKHTDYVVLFKGSALYVLKDLRQKSKTYMQNCYVKLYGNKMKYIIIPTGIAHGFYFYEDSGYAYGVDNYYKNSDEIRFNYLDDDCKFKWPSKKIIMTKRDRMLPPLKKVLNKLT